MHPVWQLEARKFDGSLHYRMPVVVRADDGVRLWVQPRIGGQLEHVTRGWTRPITNPSDMIFWRDRWYNIYLNYLLDNKLDHYYCNISLPPVVTDSTLMFVDLDLDLQIWPNGAFQLLDSDEFKAHSVQLGYPPEVRRSACLAVLDVLILWRAKRYPFDETLPER